MEPLLFRDGLQMERTRGASLAARATADALCAVIDRLAIATIAVGMCVELAAPDALPAGRTFL